MITINLLPPLKKQELRLRGLYVAIKNLMYTVLLLTILSTIVLLATKALLQNHFNQTVAESTLTLKSGKIFNNDIRIFNQQLSAVDSMQAAYVPWSTFFAALVPVVPKGVTLATLQIIDERGQKAMTLTGVAATRADLLALQAGLEEFGLLEHVKVPLESLLKPQDISFTIKAAVNLTAPRTGL